MKLSDLIQKWCSINEKTKIVIVTDDTQRSIADRLQGESIYDVQIVIFPLADPVIDSIKSLRSSDLVIAAFSIDTYIKHGANKYFSPFSKPDFISAKYIFLRLEISLEALLMGLSTDKKAVYEKIDEMSHIHSDTMVKVTNASGTDMVLRVQPFTTCSHEIVEDGGMVFLPPSETSAEVIDGTANGRIIVDTTIGQLYHFGKLMGYFGLVPSPITITVKNGFITDVSGNEMALEIKEKLFSLPIDCRKMVELGQGLSQIKPTGLIGVDESMIDTCHFGFGNGGTCGTHWDVVILNPIIKQ